MIQSVTIRGVAKHTPYTQLYTPDKDFDAYNLTFKRVRINASEVLYLSEVHLTGLLTDVVTMLIVGCDRPKDAFKVYRDPLSLLVGQERRYPVNWWYVPIPREGYTQNIEHGTFVKINNGWFAAGFFHIKDLRAQYCVPGEGYEYGKKHYRFRD